MDKLYNVMISNSNLLVGTWLVILVFVLYRIHQLFSKNRELIWTTIISSDADGKSVSLTKVLNLVGGIIGSWIVMKMTLQNTITWDILTAYLTYCGGTASFSKYINAKFRSSENTNINQP
jgi:hypothetical protein